MTSATLYVFTISHYCEKAKWALDYLQIPYELKVLAPGSHIKIAQSVGLKRGSVPFLHTDKDVIQGSDAIINWAEKQDHGSDKNLHSDNQDVIEIEKRLDEKLGVHIRRWFYSEAILEYPELVKPIFMHQLSVWEKLKLSVRWPVIRKLMTQRMELGYEQGLESMRIVEQELDWLESLIKPNSSFISGAEFSRADITAASLLAPLVAPPEYSCTTMMALPPRAKEQSIAMQDRNFWPWVLDLYRRYRQ